MPTNTPVLLLPEYDEIIDTLCKKYGISPSDLRTIITSQFKTVELGIKEAKNTQIKHLGKFMKSWRNKDKSKEDIDKQRDEVFKAGITYYTNWLEKSSMERSSDRADSQE